MMMYIRGSPQHGWQWLYTWRMVVVMCWLVFLERSILCPSSWFHVVTLVQAHSRWVCPPPRNPDTAIKTGPCGSETNVFSTSNIPFTIEPGPLLVQWEESIHHTGAPFRIALSQEGSDDEPCLLLDHIPHFDAVPEFPIFGNDTTYTLYSLTIDIPDIQCDSCSLHLANPMTDKIGDDGLPNGIGCTDPLGTCFSVYHSCTIPITISGTTPRSQYICPNTNPDDWPTVWSGDDGQVVDASTMGVYRREGATWEQSFLSDVGENYRTYDTNTLLSCTKTELFPTQIDAAPTTIFVPSPTNVPTVVPETNIPTITKSVAPSMRQPIPTGTPVTTTLDETQVQRLIQLIIEAFANVRLKAMARLRAIF